MMRCFLKIILIASLLSGAAAQTLACVSMMQADGHACCRNLASKRTSIKVRAVPASQQEPVKAPDCCKTNPAGSHQKPADNPHSKIEVSDLLADDSDGEIHLLKKPDHIPAQLLPPSLYSPPHYIRNRAILI